VSIKGDATQNGIWIVPSGRVLRPHLPWCSQGQDLVPFLVCFQSHLPSCFSTYDVLSQVNSQNSRWLKHLCTSLSMLDLFSESLALGQTGQYTRRQFLYPLLHQYATEAQSNFQVQPWGMDTSFLDTEESLNASPQVLRSASTCHVSER
jgi:hypothetical protein